MNDSNYLMKSGDEITINNDPGKEVLRIEIIKYENDLVASVNTSDGSKVNVYEVIGIVSVVNDLLIGRAHPTSPSQSPLS